MIHFKCGAKCGFFLLVIVHWITCTANIVAVNSIDGKNCLRSFFCINSFNHNKLIFYGCIMWEIWEFCWNLWHRSLRMMSILGWSEVIQLIGPFKTAKKIKKSKINFFKKGQEASTFGSVTLVRITFVQFLSNSRIPHTHIRKSNIIFNVYASHTKSAE